MKHILLDPATADGNGNNTATAQTPPGTGDSGSANITALIEKARKEEKAKLFDKISALEKEVERLNGVVTKSEATITTLTQERDNAVGALDAIKSAKTADGATVDVKGLVEELSNASKKETKKLLDSTAKELNERIAALEAENRRLTLSKAKADIIQELGGSDEVIERMISGNTPEELRATALESKKILEETRAKIRGAGSLNTGNASQSASESGAATPPTIPSAGNAGAGRTAEAGDALLRSVRGMTPAEYAAHREKIKLAATGRLSAPSNALINR